MRVGAKFIENKYCSRCCYSHPFLSTGEVVQLQGILYAIMVSMEACRKRLWRTIEQEGHIVVKEVCDG